MPALSTTKLWDTPNHALLPRILRVLATEPIRRLTGKPARVTLLRSSDHHPGVFIGSDEHGDVRADVVFAGVGARLNLEPDPNETMWTAQGHVNSAIAFQSPATAGPARIAWVPAEYLTPAERAWYDVMMEHDGPPLQLSAGIVLRHATEITDADA